MGYLDPLCTFGNRSKDCFYAYYSHKNDETFCEITNRFHPADHPDSQDCLTEKQKQWTTEWREGQ